MKILVACEFSGIVRDAFLARGHDTLSCDLLPTEQPGPHYQGDVRDILDQGWDLMIAHPPCTYLANSGAGQHQSIEHIWLMCDALEFVKLLLEAPIAHIALENPIGSISTFIRKPDQIIQPWQFGYEETKATCLWLKELPLLYATHNVSRETFLEPRIHEMSPSPERWKNRSRTYQGIAQAMARQWG